MTSTVATEATEDDKPARPPATGGARAASILANVGNVVAGVMVTGIVVVVTLGVLSRAFKTPLLEYHEEISGYLMATFALFALPGSFENGAWVKVSLLIDALPTVVRTVIARIVLVLTTGYAALIAWYLFELARQSHSFGSTSIGGTGIHLWLPQGLVATGGLLFLVYMVCRLLGARAEVPMDLEGAVG